MSSAQKKEYWSGVVGDLKSIIPDISSESLEDLYIKRQKDVQKLLTPSKKVNSETTQSLQNKKISNHEL